MNTPEREMSIEERVDRAIKEVNEAREEYEKLPQEEKQRLHDELEKSKERMIRVLDATQTFSKELLERQFERLWPR